MHNEYNDVMHTVSHNIRLSRAHARTEEFMNVLNIK